MHTSRRSKVLRLPTPYRILPIDSHLEPAVKHTTTNSTQDIIVRSDFNQHVSSLRIYKLHTRTLSQTHVNTIGSTLSTKIDASILVTLVAYSGKTSDIKSHTLYIYIFFVLEDLDTENCQCGVDSGMDFGGTNIDDDPDLCANISEEIDYDLKVCLEITGHNDDNSYEIFMDKEYEGTY